jgi:hypothetical protein
MRVWSLAFVVLAASCGGAGSQSAIDGGRDANSPDATEAASPDAPVGLDSGGSDSSSNDCTGPGLAKVWEGMDHAGMTATSAANLNLAQGGGITLAEAQATLCPGTELSSLRDGFHVQAWGASNEVELVFDPTSGDGQELSLFPGYLGTLEFKSDPALGPQHSYTMGLGQATEDGTPLVFVWTVTPFTAGNEIFNALMYTYGSPMGLYSGPVTSCTAINVCPYNTSGGQAQWNIVPLGITFTFNGVDTQPAASTVNEIDLPVP